MSTGRIFDQGPVVQRRLTWRVDIGTLVANGWMTPTAGYFIYHGDAWLKYRPDEPWRAVSARPQAGVYAAVLASGLRTGIYEEMCGVYGARTSNVMMDCTIAAVCHPADGAAQLLDNLKHSVLFSGRGTNVEKLREILPPEFTVEKRTEFMLGVARQVAARGQLNMTMTLVVDHETWTAPAEAEGEEPKSESFYLVMGIVDGVAVYFDLDWDAKTAGEAVNRSRDLLTEMGYTVAMAILNHTVCSEEELNTIEIPWEVIMPENSAVLENLNRESGKYIRWNPACEMENQGIYGAVFSKSRLQGVYDCMECAAIFFDPVRGAKESLVFQRSLTAVEKNTRALIMKGQKTEIPPEFERYLFIAQEDSVLRKTDRIDEVMTNAGCTCVACSRTRTIRQIHRDIQLTKPAVDQVNGMRSALATQDFRSRAEVEVACMVRFLAASANGTMNVACRTMNVDLEDMRSTLSSISFFHDGVCFLWDNIWTDQQREFFRLLDVDAEYIRNITMVANMLVMPEDELEKQKDVQRDFGPRMRRRGVTEPKPEKPKRGRGRPKGSRNRSTLQREAEEATRRAADLDDLEDIPHSGRGQNREKVKEWEAQLDERVAAGELTLDEAEKMKTPDRRRRLWKRESAATVELRRPGRPAGSRNKSMLDWEEMLESRREAGVLTDEQVRRMRKIGRKRSIERILGGYYPWRGELPLSDEDQEIMERLEAAAEAFDASDGFSADDEVEGASDAPETAAESPAEPAPAEETPEEPAAEPVPEIPEAIAEEFAEPAEDEIPEEPVTEISPED